jgi:hypothetical protein
MKNDDEVMSAEEFFGGLENKKKAPARKGRSRAKKSANDLFAEVKVKMVMRVYGVTKARALEILADRADEKKPSEASADNSDENEADEEDVPFMSAEEFFGACK